VHARSGLGRGGDRRGDDRVRDAAGHRALETLLFVPVTPTAGACGAQCRALGGVVMAMVEILATVAVVVMVVVALAELGEERRHPVRVAVGMGVSVLAAGVLMEDEGSARGNDAEREERGDGRAETAVAAQADHPSGLVYHHAHSMRTA
jgi:hypothetical protein